MKIKPSVDAVLFDIDNVLIDTRRSYLDAIRWTVELYLTHGNVPLFHTTRESKKHLLLTSHDVDRFKLLGGFNDDWDCCYGILIYLLSLPLPHKNMTELKKAFHSKALADQIPDRPVGVNGMVKRFGRSSHVTIEKISRIFQEVYLGPEIFEMVERKKAVYWNRKGLIAREKLIFKPDLLDKIKSRGIRLGIATGRSRFEAVFSLKHFGILDYFDEITTIDEVKKAEREQKCSLRKPHPFSLIQTAKKIGAKKTFMYVGDLPDDILAAQRAQSEISIRSVAFPAFTSDPAATERELERIRPDLILKRPRGLLKFVGGMR